VSEHDAPAPSQLVQIDTMTGGLTGVTAGFLIPAERPALIECGPALTIEATVSALRALGMDPDDLAYLVVTHVHLDHAGGAGDLLQAFPRATVVVSARGARHLSDPARLNASARQVYGELFDTVYGPCTPIAADRVLGVEDGHVLDLGAGRTLELMDTPGHAKHHIGVFDPDLGALFSGDSVGVRLEGMTDLRPATPPADFNLETSLETLARYRQRAPEHLYLAHFGRIAPADATLEIAQDRVRAWVSAVEEARGNVPAHEEEIAHVARMLEDRFAADLIDPALRSLADGPGPLAPAPDGSLPDGPDADGPDADDASPPAPPRTDDPTAALRRLDLLNDARSNAAGILRYLRRRDDGTLTRLG
jgi:glyoxylase-like metal-dependent hydrolase (beta-lactamase superfamily II)